MKQIDFKKANWLILIALLFTNLLFAQFPNVQGYNLEIIQASQNDEGEALFQGQAMTAFWDNDFSDCNDWLIDNAYNNGVTTYSPFVNFACGAVEPSGSFALEPIASTTSENGFMLVDSDLNGGSLYGNSENCWFQTLESIDCSTHPYVALSVETYYRKWNVSGSSEYCLLEVSRDGITWPDINTFEVSEGFVDFDDGDGSVQCRWEFWPELLINETTDNPTLKTFNISSVAGGQETIWIRFRWRGQWGYSWMVDDAALFEFEPLQNDLALTGYQSYTDFENTGMYEYGIWPSSQITEVQIAADVTNLGAQTQNEVGLSVFVDGTPVGTSTSGVLAYQQSQLFQVTGYTPPTTPGTYSMELIAEPVNDDEDPENNSISTTFEVSDYTFARDNGLFTDQFPNFNYNDEFITAVPYQFYGDGNIHAVQVALTAGNPEADMICHIMDENLNVLTSSSFLALNTSFLNDEFDSDNIQWYTFVFDEPWPVSNGDMLLASFQTFGGSNIRVGTAQETPDLTAFVYGDFGSGLNEWFFYNSVPMVRFSFDPNAFSTGTSGCPDPLACNYQPNPTIIESCTYPGCTDALACNYNANAGCDDGSCYYSENCDFCGENAVFEFSAGSFFYPNGELGQSFNEGFVNNTYEDAVLFRMPDTLDGIPIDSIHVGNVLLNTGGIDFSLMDLGLSYTCSESVNTMGECSFLPLINSCLRIEGIPNQSGLFNLSLEVVVYVTVFGILVPQETVFDIAPLLISVGALGCTDPMACNFESTAGADDGSCLYFDDCGECGGSGIAGCTDSDACNFNPLASCSDDACLYLDVCGECGGNGMLGCTDAAACNFNADASCDDASCVFAPEVSISGPVVVNEFTEASYSVLGGFDAEFDWTVTGGAISGDNGESIDVFWAGEGLSEICVEVLTEDCPNVVECATIVITPVTSLLGCTNSQACNFNPNATVDNGTCFFIGDFCNDGDPNTINDMVQLDCECAGETVVELAGCTNAIACNYNAEANLDDGSCLFVGDACDDGNLNTINDTIQANCECLGEDPDPSTGCTDPEACNYSPVATSDDGSCEYVQIFSISGLLAPSLFTNEIYTYPESIGSSYLWSTSFGAVVSGQGTSQVAVTWGTQGTGELCITETRSDGCTGQEVCVNVVVLPTNIDEDKESEVLIFPNPASEILNFSLEQSWIGGVFTLIDNLGRTVREGRIDESSFTMSVENINAGRYELNLQNEGRSLTKAVLIQR